VEEGRAQRGLSGVVIGFGRVSGEVVVRGWGEEEEEEGGSGSSARSAAPPATAGLLLGGRLRLGRHIGIRIRRQEGVIGIGGRGRMGEGRVIIGGVARRGRRVAPVYVWIGGGRRRWSMEGRVHAGVVGVVGWTAVGRVGRGRCEH
jgi:hypothetical protein